ncbi:GntR family transcriptional regulator [Streptomyces roseifaciens]
MTLQLEDDPRPPYMQAAEVLRKEIQAGRLKPGDKLPSARDLQERYNLASSTVQNALRLLKSEGLIYSVQGRGSFVRNAPGVQEDGAAASRIRDDAGRDRMAAKAIAARAAGMHSDEYNDLAQQIAELSATVDDLRGVIRDLTTTLQKKSQR